MELETITAKNGLPYTIYHSKTLALSPAYPNFLKGVAEMVENDTGYGMTFWKDEECEAFYIRQSRPGENGPVVASSVFKPVPAQHYIWIEMTSISEGHRGLKLYQFIHKHYESYARSYGYKKLSGNVNVKNIASVKQRESVGFVTRLLVQDKIIK